MKTIKKDPLTVFGRYICINNWYGWRMFWLRFLQGPAHVIDGLVQTLTLGFIETSLSVVFSELKLKAMMAEYKRRKNVG